MINYNKKLFSYQNLFNHFINLEIEKKLPSRILLSGQEGIGKKTFAFHFINYLFSKNEETKYDIIENKINDRSISFNLTNNLSHPNFYFISIKEGKKNIEIDQIRTMINFLNKSSFDNNKKIILIDGSENLNINSSNALLKSLEESNIQNMFILIHNVNKKILPTIKSRCINFNFHLEHKYTQNIILEYFNNDLFNELNSDFKNLIVSPNFLINHIIFLQENDLDLSQSDVKNTIDYIITNKSYKKSEFIMNYFQSYIEIYFSKMYSKTKEYKYYDNFIKTVTENSMVNNFNLDLDSFFIKFENKYLNI